MVVGYYVSTKNSLSYCWGELVVELTIEPDTRCWNWGSMSVAGMMVVLTMVAE